MGEAELISGRLQQTFRRLIASFRPQSGCVVGVQFATELASRLTRATDGERQRVVLKDGREQTIEHWRLENVWMRDEEFLITAPRCDNYDHDTIAQDEAVRRIVLLSKDL